MQLNMEHKVKYNFIHKLVFHKVSRHQLHQQLWNLTTVLQLLTLKFPFSPNSRNMLLIEVVTIKLKEQISPRWFRRLKWESEISLVASPQTS